MSDKKQFLTRKEYYDKMGDRDHVYTFEDCPFCAVEDNAGHTLWKGENWYILHNISPYTWDGWHIMAVPYRHHRFFSDLDKDEISEIPEVHSFVKTFFWEKHYFSCTRETMANRSIEHFHMHFISGKLQGKYLRKMLEDQGFPIKQDL